MIGSFLTRALVLVLGYAYPAYDCYKTVELNKPEIEQLRFWCQYWILVAMLTVFESVGETFVSWIPMYSEAKLAFYVYLWYPRTKGTTYVYDTFLRPYVAKHETEIDRNLLELRTRAGDIAVLYWQKAASYSQTRIFEVLQYVAAQSQPQPAQPRPVPRPQQQHRPTQAPVTAAPRPATALQQPQAPPSPSKFQQQQQQQQPPPVQQQQQPQPTQQQPQQQEPAKSGDLAAPEASTSFLRRAISAPIAALSPANTPSNSENSAEAPPAPTLGGEAMEAEPADATTAAPNVDRMNPPAAAQETVMEEVIRVTRGRLRRAATAAAAGAASAR